MGQSLCCPKDEQEKKSNKPHLEIPVDDLPYRCYEILKIEENVISSYTEAKLNDMLRSGILLKYMTKYWVEKKKNCFMLFAKNLRISEEGDCRKWSWQRFKEQKDMSPEIAVMEEVKKFSISGLFDSKDLSPETKYKVAFVLNFRKDKSPCGWDTPVEVVFIPPGKYPIADQQRSFATLTPYLDSEKSFEIKVGEFMNPENPSGELGFCLQSDNEEKKTGLVVRGVKIVPVGTLRV